MAKTLSFEGHIVDIPNRQIIKGIVHCENGKITAIEPKDTVADQYIFPGFIDAHIHIESSMLVPSEFARIAVLFGTVATVSDPHEIANVLGSGEIQPVRDNSYTVAYFLRTVY